MNDSLPVAETARIATVALGPVSSARSHEIECLREAMEELPQTEMPIEHHLHAGVYSRTLMQPAGVLCCAAMLKIPTQLVVSGHCRILSGNDVIEINGYKVLEGLPGRQLVIYTIEDTWATAMFATEAKTVEEAELEAVGPAQFELLTNHHVKELPK